MTPGTTVFNFIHKDLPKSDRELFFGPLLDSDIFIEFDDSWKMEHFMTRVGLFPSVTQARKQIGTQDIAPGFQFVFKGKKSKGVFTKALFILNKF